MKKEFLEQQEKRLKELKKEVESQLSQFATKDKQLKNNWKSKFPEFDGTETGGSHLEVAQDEVEEYLNRLPVEHILELKLKDINDALKKIKTGKYGICERCGRRISQNRLKIFPEAKFCLKCQKQ